MVREIFEPENSPSKLSASAWITFLGTAGAFLGTAALSRTVAAAFNGMFLLDPFASFFKIFFAGATAVIILMSRAYLAHGFRNTSEYFLILLCTLLGFFFLVSANDFLAMFIALEIVTLSFYITTAFAKDRLSSIEAGLKYLIIGSLASAFMIFGISLIYSVTGTTSFPDIRNFLTTNPCAPLLGLGIILVITALAFKIAAFPFQFWVPDVYEGAPSPVVAFLSVASKAAGFAVLLRLNFSVFDRFEMERVTLTWVIALVTLFYGNLGGLLQTNIKRLLGYSSIGHAGYLLMGIAAGKNFGTQALLYYLMAYAFSTLSAFYVVSISSVQLQSNSISAYRGLGKRSPFLAGILFLALLSLAGVPPLAGFSGKYFILFAAVGANLNWLAFAGTAMVAVSLYYYLNIVRVMYFDDPSDEHPLVCDKVSKATLIALALASLAAGIWHAPFLRIAAIAARYLT